MQQNGFTVWLTGLSAAGKTTVANRLRDRLLERGREVEILDGDVIRTNLSKGLGYSKDDRQTNIRRIGFVCELLTRHGVAVVASAISPYQDTRREVRQQIGHFVEVFVDCPLEVCIQRDPKGLYKRALAGEISSFTGIDDPYEPPERAEVHLYTDQEEPDQSVERVVARLTELGYLPPAWGPPAGPTGKARPVPPEQSVQAAQDDGPLRNPPPAQRPEVSPPRRSLPPVVPDGASAVDKTPPAPRSKDLRSDAKVCGRKKGSTLQSAST